MPCSKLLEKHPAKLVLMPHTYQVRDFVPKLATRPANHRHQRRHRIPLRSRQAALHAPDVSRKIRRRRELRRQRPVLRHLPKTAPTAPIKSKPEQPPRQLKTVNVEIPDGIIRNKPEEVFKESQNKPSI